MDKRGLAIIERPADAVEIHLIVKAIRADGVVIEIPVVIQGATGEIEIDTPLPAAKFGAADTLSKTLAVASAAANDEAAMLAAAFSSQA
jgi:large repetitive protein